VGFLVLLAVGAALGWAATIITRRDDGRSIMTCVAAGSAGALVAGILASGESLVFGLSAVALLSGIAGAVVVLAGMHLARTRSIG
jgi:uncharacterized membrane protein YeaQ/YmgE (transglycosylase-associated protein family)